MFPRASVEETPQVVSINITGSPRRLAKAGQQMPAGEQDSRRNFANECMIMTTNDIEHVDNTCYQTRAQHDSNMTTVLMLIIITATIDCTKATPAKTCREKGDRPEPHKKDKSTIWLVQKGQIPEPRTPTVMVLVIDSSGDSSSK